MNQRKKQITIYALLFTMLVFFVFVTVSCFVFPSGRNKRKVDLGYSIKSYSANITVNEDNSYDVTETISVFFSVPRHGIYRYLPIFQKISVKENGKIYTVRYKNQYLNGSSSEEVEILTEGNNKIIKIGDADKLTSGEKTYQLSYTITIGDDKIKDFDQFYFNVLGFGWDTTISDISINVDFVKPVADGTPVVLYVGKYGTTKETIVSVQNNSFSYTNTGTLQAFNGVTARVVLKEGYFETEKASSALDILILVVAALVFGFTIYFVLIKKNNKITIPVVEFKAPDGMTPADVGYVLDKRVDRKDIASLIVFWANNGYIKIVDDGFKLVKIKEADEKMKHYEKDVFNSLFNQKDSVFLPDLSEASKDNESIIVIASAISRAKNEIKDDSKQFFNLKTNILIYVMLAIIPLLTFALFMILKVKLAFPQLGIASCFIAIASFLGFLFLLGANVNNFANSKKLRICFLILGWIFLCLPSLVAMFYTFDMYSNPLMISIFVPILLALSTFLISLLNIRTNDGIKAFGSIVGLKDYIKTAEKDRIEMLAKESPEIFFEFLPYAFVLGVSDVWIKKFENLVPVPNWYEGTNSSVFFGYGILNSMDLTNNVYNSPSASQSFGGGFGGDGGGFGGGGSGGGGGGSW